MFIRTPFVAVLMTLALSASAAAKSPSNEDGRFTMSPVEGGFLRLDSETGAVAMCAQSAGSWACNPVADHTDAPSSNELSRLKDENRELKERIKELEANTPPPGSPPLAEAPPGTTELPTEEQVDQALDYLEHVYKKIRDRIKKLDEPPAGDTRPDTGTEAPDKDSL